MKYAGIAPTGYLRDIKGQPVHMTLAHLMDCKKYEEFYRDERENGSFIILDNSIVELGFALGVEDLLQAAEKVGAHEIIVPDVFRDAKGTIENAKNYIPELRARYNGRLMGVAHGRDTGEWLNCAEKLIRLGVDTIGIPKVMCDILGGNGRLLCLMALQDLLLKIKRKPAIHLLGIWETPLEVAALYNAERKFNWHPIRSVDSVIAYKYAENYMHFEDGERPDGHTEFIGDFDSLTKTYHLHNLIECWQLAGGNMRPMSFQAYKPLIQKSSCPPIKDGNVTHAVFGQDN